MIRVNKRVAQALKNYRVYKNSVLTKNAKPCKELTHKLEKSYGRNHTGCITVRHKSRGVKRLYRDISFARLKFDVVGTVKSIEYDPNRTAFIALVNYEDDNTNEYILHPIGLKVGDKIVVSKSEVSECPGNATLLKNIADRTFINCIEIYPGKGGKLARSAGTYGEILGQHEDGYTIVKLSSGAVMRIKNTCTATIGQVSNEAYANKVMYKAGQARKKGIRPTVRGVAMNPVDHPHGGGEGKTGVKRHPVSIYGKLTKGKKTAKANRVRKKFIIKERKKRK